ncbi:50S ribosomal protein L4 [archaeon]|nr:50S ribosomal protein L4 [archaeon]
MNVNSLSGKKVKNISLPEQFQEPVRKDLIKRAYNALRTRESQSKGVSPSAGMRHAVDLKKRRRSYKAGMGIGRSRTPKKTHRRKGRQFTFIGTQAPFTKGGRKAHPPKSAKSHEEKINKKERRKAIRSAISGSKIMIIENKLESLDKTSKVIKALKDNGLEVKSKKRLKKGKARLRGRGRTYSKNALLIVSKKCGLSNSGKNIPGVEVSLVNELNVKKLAPGAVPGRSTVWTEDAIKKMKEGLYL